MITGNFFVFLVVFGAALAYKPGQYVPKSFYIIDSYGHQSEPVLLRSRRDIMDNPFVRVRRVTDSPGFNSATGHSSASAGSGASAGGGSGTYFGEGGRNGATAYSFASSSSSSNAGNGAARPSSGGSGQGFGGLGSGQNAGYQGPILFSRFGEAEGTGVHVSGQAQGRRGAFSSSSSSIDDRGKIKYSVQSGKY